MARFSNSLMNASLRISLIGRVIVALCFLVPACCFIACQNGEDIGDLYGIWQLQTISMSNGKVLQPTNLYLSFHGDVVEAKQVNPESHGYVNLFGSLSVDGDVVTMQFLEIDPSVVTCQYLLEQCFHFPADQVCLTMHWSGSNTLCFEQEGTQWQFKKR